jgi:hypothetical protein
MWNFDAPPDAPIQIKPPFGDLKDLLPKIQRHK